MLVHWIWLSTRPAVSDRQKLAILQAFADPEDAFFAEKEEYTGIEGLSAEEIAALCDKDLTQTEKILRQCEEKGISVYPFSHDRYPERLKNIADPPLVLYGKGTLPDMDAAPVLAVVGTRKASAYGQTVAQRMGYQLAQCGGIVVSGGAEGIDAAAMHGALLAGGTVIGVLGCGADVVYPKSNRFLFSDVAAGGCLLTEYPPGTPPLRWNFPKRNRIISGMSNGVTVVEAPERSGSLITARQAAEQGRDVFVVPGNVDVDSFVGSNALLREGATPVRDGWDVISEYKSLYPDAVRRPLSAELPTDRAPVPRVAQKPAAPVKEKPTIKPSAKAPAKKEQEPPPRKAPVYMSDEEKRIVELLTAPQLVDEIIAQTGMSTAKVMALLTILEIKGVVKRLPGKRVCRK